MFLRKVNQEKIPNFRIFSTLDKRPKSRKIKEIHHSQKMLAFMYAINIYNYFYACQVVLKFIFYRNEVLQTKQIFGHIIDYL